MEIHYHGHENQIDDYHHVHENRHHDHDDYYHIHDNQNDDYEPTWLQSGHNSTVPNPVSHM